MNRCVPRLPTPLLLALALAACGGGTMTSSDGGSDSHPPEDTALEASSDGGSHDAMLGDVPEDALRDASHDVTSDAVSDAASDATTDTGTDATDVATEAATDAAVDSAADTSDVTNDVPADATTEDSPSDAVSDGASDVAADVVVDAPADTGTCSNPDVDGDGHASIACGGDDCDDNDANRFPGNPEVCLYNAATMMRVNPAHDEDCDPTTFSNPVTHDGDADGDGFVDVACLNVAANGMVYGGTDCADTAPVAAVPASLGTSVQPQFINPGATEQCNGVDDNCNGQIDEGDPGGGTACTPASANVCAQGVDHCVGGTVSCVVDYSMGGYCCAGFADCNGSPADGCEAQLSSDPQNCGACGSMCASSAGTPVCTAGVCSYASCSSPSATLCSGACVDVTSDTMNCNACGAVCPSPIGGTATCTNGVCGGSCPAGLALCNGACVDTLSDANNCGACGQMCASTSGTPACVMGACGYTSCNAPLTLCGTACDDLTSDVANCGSCGNACASAANASVACVASACAYTCNAGYVQLNGVCVVAPPRQVAPLSTATVTSQTPTLHWVLGPAADGAHVLLCRDRALTIGCINFDSTGSAGAPPSALTPGQWFWQLTPRSAGTIGAATSPTWQFTVGHLSAPLDDSWGTTPDLNGDGYADMLVGANVGNEAFVYNGGPGGLSSTPLTIVGPTGSGQFGAAIASAGDVNGDGFADLIVGAQTSNTAYIYLGGANGPSTTPIVLTSPAGGNFGRNAASAGDVNGDGYADVAVAAPVGNTVYVYLGSATGVGTTPTALTQAGPYFGLSLTNAGDINGDGYGDILVASNNSTTAYVYYGSTNGIVTTPTTLTGPAAGNYGNAISGAGDLNGDGYSDLAVAAWNNGQVYVYYGAASGIVPTAMIVTGSAGYRFGEAVGGGSDINGDGYDDLLVTQGNSRGFVYFGSPSGLVTTPVTLLGPNLTGWGQRVALLGDVNGDGFGELAIGTPGQEIDLFMGAATGVVTPYVRIVPPSYAIDFGISIARADTAADREWTFASPLRTRAAGPTLVSRAPALVARPPS